MDYKVLVDSCVDLSERTAQDQTGARRVPFTVTIDGEDIKDSGSSVLDRLNAIRFAARSIRTACPSPGDFLEALDGARKAFIVTISRHLSGSHAAAVAAREQLREQYGGDCDIRVLDSASASAGESLVMVKLLSLLRENLPISAVTERLNQYAQGLRTLFVIDSLDTLVANGRVRPLECLALKALKICPIMGDDGGGRIELKCVARGRKRALGRLVEMIGEGGQDLKNRVLGISHVNAPALAQELKRRIEEKYGFQEVLIFEAGGLSSVYASEGGIVVAY